MTVWYRYEVRHYAPPLNEFDEVEWGDVGRRELVLMELPVLRETRCGVRLKDGRFIMKQSRKRYACPTKEEALVSFKRRKEVQISILKAQLRSAECDAALVDGEPRTEHWIEVAV